MKIAGDELGRVGWVKLPIQCSSKELGNLSKLKPHRGHGTRLTDMNAVKFALPQVLKESLIKRGFDTAPNRAVGFVKSEKHNWSLPWHQDRIVAMGQRNDSPEYSNLSLKSEVWHCEPSEDILKQITFAYIAFDFSNEIGGIEIAEGTHKFGKIGQPEIDAIIAESNLVRPKLDAGDILLINALTLNRSRIWAGKGSRRTLRLDFVKTSTLLSV